MKILLANNYYYLRGGSERVFFDEMDVLREHGQEVSAFSRHYRQNIPCEYSEFFPPNFRYEDVPLTEKISSAFKLVYSIECRRKLRGLLRHLRPDLMHAHNIHGRLTSAVLDTAKASGVPVIMTLHDYKLVCPSYLMLRDSNTCSSCFGGRFYQCLLNRCHKNSIIPSGIVVFESYFNDLLGKFDGVRYFICPSRFLLEKHLEAGFPKEKLIHIPNFIDARNISPSYEHAGYILFVGRLSREKGILTLIKAVAGLDTPVIIVGDGPMRKEYESMARALGAENVYFKGHRSGRDLKEAYRNAAFVVVPSEWYEVFGLTILEAFSYGKPVIGSRIGAIPELVKDGQTGFLFSPNDHEDLRDKILRLLRSEDEIVEMGENALREVHEHFNPDLHCQKLMEIYEKAVKENG